MEQVNIESQFRRMTEIMTDEIGIVQHSDIDMPIKKDKEPYPYSIDDVARALIVLSRVSNIMPGIMPAHSIHRVYLDFIDRAKTEEGFFSNYQSLRGEPIKEQEIEQDCFGRTMWAWAEFLKGKFPEKDKEKVLQEILERVPHMLRLTYPNSEAFGLIACSHLANYLKDGETADYVREVGAKVAYKLKKRYEDSLGDGWNWFDSEITYCSARVPNSLLLASESLSDEDLAHVGKTTLDFLLSISFRPLEHEKIFYGIGNKGWFTKEQFLQGEQPSAYDQQSIEASSMTETCIDAERLTTVKSYRGIYAENAFKWFTGLNANRASLLSPQHGVYDALTEKTIENPAGLNKNQGAESIIGYLMAATRMLD